MTSERVIKEAPVPVGHDWPEFSSCGTPQFEDAYIAERFSSRSLVDWHDTEGMLPCKVFLSNGQTVIVRAKNDPRPF